MWKCLVCGKENPTTVCEECHFDGSRDYECHPTLTRYPAGKAAISRLWGGNAPALRCPNCGSEAFSLMLAEKKLKCLQCGILFDPDVLEEIMPVLAGDTVDEAETAVEEETNLPEAPSVEEKLTKKQKPRWLKWTAAVLAAAIVLGGSAFVVIQNYFTGWVSKNGETYYYDPNHQYVTGWATIDGDTYYFDNDGHMHTGWKIIGSDNYYDTYYFDVDGRMHTGWKIIDGDTYYFNINNVSMDYGHMQTGWQDIDGNVYYFGIDGIMRTGEQSIAGTIYYFGENGALIERQNPA